MVTHSSKTWNEEEKKELKKLWIEEVGTGEEFDRAVEVGEEMQEDENPVRDP